MNDLLVNLDFMIMASMLVMLMTPGIAIFYAGLINNGNVLSILSQCFIGIGLITIVWYVVGYSLCFSGGDGGFIGNFDQALFLKLLPSKSSNIDTYQYIYSIYEMMFAIITPMLITGAFCGRMCFKPYLVIIPLWVILVYCPVAHMIWGNGFLSKLGIIDFAGGIVVHLTAGVASLAFVLFLGPRKTRIHKPHNLTLVAVGATLLWFGWYGFNAGSELQIDYITILAFFNTSLSAGSAILARSILELIINKKISFTGILLGAISGLAAVTPAAGFVGPAVAFLIGAASGILCYYAEKWYRQTRFDDALDVWAIHGIGGLVGVVILAFFASSKMNNKIPDGLVYGNWNFFLTEIIGTIAVMAYVFIVSYIIIWAVNKFSKVLVEETNQNNLDAAAHGQSINQFFIESTINDTSKNN